MSSHDLSPEALEDLRAIGAWIARGSLDRAIGLVEELRARFKRLASMPMAGRPRGEMGAGIRSVPHGAYIVSYRPTATGIDVVRVVHGRRDMSRSLP